MQRILFLDYLDGTKTVSKNKLEADGGLLNLLFCYRFAKYIDFKIVNGQVNIKYDEYVKQMENFSKHPDYKEDVQEILSNLNEDIVLKTSLADFSRLYNSKDSKNYVFSSALTKALAETEINSEMHIISEDKTFYFEMPNLEDENLQIKCVFGFQAALEDRTILPITVIAFDKKHETYRVFPMTLDLNAKDLKSAFEEKMRGDLIKELFNKDQLEYSTQNIYKTILNGIIYIFNNSEELEEKLNAFSGNKSKVETQKKIYTEKPFVELGTSFQFLRLINEQTVNVKGHWRWQPYGEKRAQVKLTYVKAHSRDIKKVIDQE